MYKYICEETVGLLVKLLFVKIKRRFLKQILKQPFNPYSRVIFDSSHSICFKHLASYICNKNILEQIYHSSPYLEGSEKVYDIFQTFLKIFLLFKK